MRANGDRVIRQGSPFRAISALLLVAASGWGVPCAAAAGAKSGAADRPNILLIMADDLGAEWLSCYGGREMETPNIDALAGSGMRFLNAYSMPKCTPTRVTLLTGQYPFRHGWTAHWDVPRYGGGFHLDPKHNPTFARLLKEAGYATAAAGKWQVNDFRVQPDVLQQHGFNEHAMWTGFETGVPASAHRYWNPYINVNGQSTVHQGAFGTDVFVDFLIDFMRRHRTQPMLLYFPMALPHGPLTTTPRDPMAAGNKERYRAMVAYVDHAVGRLVTALKELELSGRTFVFFTTDNGSSRGLTARRSGRLVHGGKDTLRESGMNVPLIVSCPGRVPPGVVTDALTDFTDLFPTFADLAGVEPPGQRDLDGSSLAGLLTGRESDSQRQWILAMGQGSMVRTAQGVRSRSERVNRVIRNKRFKLWYVDGKLSALYDLMNDPGEEHNLLDSQSPETRAARVELESVLRSLPADMPARYDPTPPQPWDEPVEAP